MIIIVTMMSQVNTGQRLVYNHLVITSSEGKVCLPQTGKWFLEVDGKLITKARIT